MVDIWPFCGTRPYNQDAKNLIAPSTDHLSIENIIKGEINLLTSKEQRPGSSQAKGSL